MTEQPTDSIFRLPRRLKNAVGILVATTTAAGCAPKPTQPPMGSTEMSGGPTSTHVETILPPLPPEIPTLTSTPKPAWYEMIETQDPQDTYFKLVDGAPTIDRYDTTDVERIKLAPESIKTIETTDGLNPNILTGQDAAGNKYAFNPDHGWFQLPEVQLDYNKLEQYTEVTQAFIEDGRANITTALLYAENPTISPDAIDPVYWVGYNSNIKIPMLCNNACGLPGEAVHYGYGNEIDKTYYDATTKPFAWTGFYKVQLENGESVYVVARTLKNTSDTNTKQTTNLFYGFDQKLYENWANTALPTGETLLAAGLRIVDHGGSDIVVALAPPERFPDGTQIPYNLNVYDWREYYNRAISELEARGQLIALFKNPAAIMDLILQGQQGHHVVMPLTEPIPNEFSKFILFAKFVNR